MKIAGTFLSALLLGALAQSAVAATLAESRFDTTVESWTTVGDATFNGWQPGGHIQGTDQKLGDNWYFSAPSAFLGNKSGATSLSFELKASNTNLYDAWDVVLVGATGTLVTDLSPSGLTAPSDTAWTPYSVSLTNASAWTSIASSAINGKPAGIAGTTGQLAGVLGSLSAVYIRGEYRTGDDSGRLDNVVMSGSVTPVPEPGGYAMLLAGLGLICTIGWRRAGR